MTDKIKALREMVEASSRIVAFTGAGCSTESGIADFRSSPGELANLGTNAPMSTESVVIVPILSGYHARPAILYAEIAEGAAFVNIKIIRYILFQRRRYHGIYGI